MKNIFVLFIVLLMIINKSMCQNAPCSTNFGFVDPKNYREQIEIPGIEKKQIMISFYDGFKGDTVFVYLNNILIKEFVLTTNADIKHTGHSLILNRKKKNDVLRITLGLNKMCFESKILNGYKSLQVSVNNMDWNVNYSNYLVITE
jgi:hypothetical protein